MSILIKGMEMPKNCAWCRFLQSHDPIHKRERFCGIDTTNNIHDYKPDKGCPLIPIPPHGRLIDADVLMNEIDKQENALYEHGHEFSFSFKSGGDVCTAWYNVEMMVEDASTIIPSEEG